jgi:hypothetical protein
MSRRLEQPEELITAIRIATTAAGLITFMMKLLE